jgi:hypothetical protein
MRACSSQKNSILEVIDIWVFALLLSNYNSWAMTPDLTVIEPINELVKISQFSPKWAFTSGKAPTKANSHHRTKPKLVHAIE